MKKETMIRVGPNEVWVKFDKWYHIVLSDSKLYIDGREIT